LRRLLLALDVHSSGSVSVSLPSSVRFCSFEPSVLANSYLEKKSLDSLALPGFSAGCRNIHDPASRWLVAAYPRLAKLSYLGEELVVVWTLPLRLLDTLFPRRCVGCKALDAWLCDTCHSELTNEANIEQINAHTVALYAFENRVIRELLHTLKYNGVHEVADIVVATLTQWCSADTLKALLGYADAVLVPIPTSNSRRKQRGYNQAELIARALGEWLAWPVQTDLLIKHKSGTLVGKSREDRRKQAGGMYRWNEHATFMGGPIVLIDDVYTTGSTVEACRAMLLKELGNEVKVVVVAHEHYIL
jgi:ComF family protein